jgi:4-carboxymuconolactone decarboxylase
MSDRLPVPPPSELSGAQRELYDEILGGPRSSGPKVFEIIDGEGGLNGPFNAMLLSPKIGNALQALGSAVRYETALNPKVREMAILSVASSWDSEFELYAHEAIGRSVGLSEADLGALRHGQIPDLDNADDIEVLTVVQALLRRADLDDAEYAEARARLGVEMLFEIATLVGYYSALALQLRVFRVDSPSSAGG